MTNIVDLSNEHYLGENLDGIDLSDAILKDTVFQNCSLIGANFTKSDLWGAEFLDCNLSHSLFERADLLGTKIEKCRILESDFHRATISGTICANSDFSASKFVRATIVASTFSKSILVGADLTDSVIATVDFAGADLTDAIGIPNGRQPIFIHGLDYPVTIYDGKMSVGCQTNSLEWFYNDTPGNRGIAAMEGLKSRRFWKKHKHWIFELIKAEGIKMS